MAHVVILGAGLTGLSAAYHFEQAGFHDFEIFEQQDSAGGLLRSFHVDGFTFDYTGHLLHINDDYFSSFINTITSFDTFLKVTRKTAIYSHERYSNYPYQMNLYGLPTDVIYECINGYINRPKSRSNPKNFHEWVIKYFGAGMGKHFFFPYNSKILAYDVRRVLPSWTGRFVPQTSLEAVLQGAIEPRDVKNVGYNSQFYYPKHGGIQHLINSLRAAVQKQPKTFHKAVEIDLTNKKIIFENGTEQKFEKIISTMPLNELLAMLKGRTLRSYQEAAEKLICNSVINFNLGFKKDLGINQHWIYYPEKKYPFYRIGFWHNINQLSVKPGHSAIYGETSFIRKKTSKIKQEKLIATCISEALKLLGRSEQDIVVNKVLQLPYAYVIYDAWREKHLSAVLKNLLNDGIISTGRYGGWKYSSMQEAVIDGKLASELLAPKYLAARVKKTVSSNQEITPVTELKKGESWSSN